MANVTNMLRCCFLFYRLYKAFTVGEGEEGAWEPRRPNLDVEGSKRIIIFYYYNIKIHTPNNVYA